jgi:hypothetical protein
MLIESLSLKSVSRFSMVGAVAIALILGGPNLAKAESRDRAVDRLTDFLFYKVNPELNNRKLQAGDRNYILEWQRLRAEIDPRVKPAQEVCNSPGPGDIGWEFTVINGETYEQTYDRLADIIFYSRHPQMTGQPISIGDRARSNEWLAIRREMYISNCGL